MRPGRFEPAWEHGMMELPPISWHSTCTESLHGLEEKRGMTPRADECGLSSPSTINHPPAIALAKAGQPSTSFWLPLETVPGGTALPTIWKRHLGPEFETFSSLFLKARPDEPAQFVPCPWNCGCSHKVVPQRNGILHGVCQCKVQACDT